jgi:hypothetical protein
VDMLLGWLRLHLPTHTTPTSLNRFGGCETPADTNKCVFSYKFHKRRQLKANLRGCEPNAAYSIICHNMLVFCTWCVQRLCVWFGRCVCVWVCHVYLSVHLTHHVVSMYFLCQLVPMSLFPYSNNNYSPSISLLTILTTMDNSLLRPCYWFMSVLNLIFPPYIIATRLPLCLFPCLCFQLSPFYVFHSCM